MRYTEIKTCYIGPDISPEQFIPQHFFIYIAKGRMDGYDGHQKYTLKAGDYCIVRKNRLARYNKQKDNGQFEKVVIILDEKLLRNFKEKYNPVIRKHNPKEAFLAIHRNNLIPEFIRSLSPYYGSSGRINDTFSDIKREELLLILLENDPLLSGVLFDFGQPEKTDLEEYMSRNYKFNVSIQRFAFLTGRSLSAFKRDFMEAFSDTPGRWLLHRRLREAHFLIERKGQRPSDIYLGLGFEDFSHFSFAFKKTFGVSPSEVVKK